ncbi:MAG: hypothetical protein Q9219_007355 [cf. Caloplaca sp. 3 TL-2023]
MPRYEFTASVGNRTWQLLPSTPGDPTIPPNTYVPDAPTPRPLDLSNDTPTPAFPTPGSWIERRRTGELVERPPTFRLNAPDGTVFTYPEIQSTPEWQPTATLGPRSLDSGTHIPVAEATVPPAPGSRMNPPDNAASTSLNTQTIPEGQSTSTSVPELHPYSNYQPSSVVTKSSSSSSSKSRKERKSSSSTSSKSKKERRNSRPESNETVQRPPAAKVTSRHDQLDGAPDEGEPRPAPKRRSSCQNLQGSLRNLPQQLKELFSKEKTNNNAKKAEDKKPAKSSTPKKENQSWWSRTTGRFRKGNDQGKKTMPGRVGQRATRNSLRHLFSSSGAPDPESRESSGSAGPGTDRFDDENAPQAFGAPTHEEDISSPTEPHFDTVDSSPGEEEEESSSASGSRGQRRFEAIKPNAREEGQAAAQQVDSGGEANGGVGLDGSQDAKDESERRKTSGTSFFSQAFGHLGDLGGWNAMP